MSNNSNKRKTSIDIYPATDIVIKNHDINLTREFNEFIQSKYGSVRALEAKADELKNEKKEKIRQKHELELEINDIEDKLDRINRLRTRNDIIQKIKSSPEKRKVIQERVMTLKKAKMDGDSQEEMEQYVHRQAEIARDKGLEEFEQETLEETLKLMAEIA